MTTLWDDNYSDDCVEKWLYGKRSLQAPTRKWFMDRISNMTETITLLDAGCGGGVTAFQLKKQNLLHKVIYTGVDFSDVMLRLARKKVPDVKWIKASLNDLELKQKFDFVLLRAVLAHVENPEPVLSSVIRHTKRSGELFIVFWNNPSKEKTFPRKISGGFFDTSHSRELLENILLDNDMYIHEEIKLKETSALSNYRLIWIVKSKQSNSIKK